MLSLLVLSILVATVHNTRPAPIGLRNLATTCYLNAVTQNVYGLPSVKKEIIEAAVEEGTATFMFACPLARLDERKDKPVDLSCDFFQKIKELDDVTFKLDQQDDAQVYFDWLVKNVFPPTTKKYMQSTTAVVSQFKGITYKEQNTGSESTYKLYVAPKDTLDIEEKLNNPTYEVIEDVKISTPKDCNKECKERLDEIEKEGAIINGESVNKITQASKLIGTSEILTIHVVMNKAIANIDYKLTEETGGKVNYKHVMVVLGKKYHLNGVVYHNGTSKGGHYIAKVKDHETDKWFTLNDTLVTECSEQEVLEHTKNAYLLFYVQEDLALKWKDDKKTYQPSVPKIVTEINEIISLSYNDTEEWQNEINYDSTNDNNTNSKNANSGNPPNYNDYLNYTDPNHYKDSKSYHNSFHHGSPNHKEDLMDQFEDKKTNFHLPIYKAPNDFPDELDFNNFNKDIKDNSNNLGYDTGNTDDHGINEITSVNFESINDNNNNVSNNNNDYSFEIAADEQDKMQNLENSIFSYEEDNFQVVKILMEALKVRLVDPVSDFDIQNNNSKSIILTMDSKIIGTLKTEIGNLKGQLAREILDRAETVDTIDVGNHLIEETISVFLETEGLTLRDFIKRICEFLHELFPSN